jgi:hypothetical protein
VENNRNNVRPFAHRKYGHPGKQEKEDFTILGYLEVKLDSYVMLNLTLLSQVPLKYIESEMC